MARTAKIILGGQEYEVSKFNIGQLERVSEIIVAGGSPVKSAFGILRIAFERATPSVEFDEIEADEGEIETCMTAVMGLAGLRTPAANPPTPEEAPAKL